VAIFSVGFFLIALIQLCLYLRAASKVDDLCLNQMEQLLIRKELLVWVVQAVLALLVALIALTFKSSLGYLAGLAYSLTPVLVPLITLPTRKKIRAGLSAPGNEAR
jgi:hypothetical protein